MSAIAKLGFLKYRSSTVLKSFKTLYTLPPEKIDAFLTSYEIYDYDWANEEELVAKMGADYYGKIKQKLIDWYSVLNHLCAIGQVEKMYIPPAMDLSKSIIENQLLFEKKLAQDLGLERGHTALDIGCGRGRVAGHMATHTGAHITGLNLDPDQLENARRFAKGHNLPCIFRQGDLNDIPLPFTDGSFNAIYHIQAFSMCKDLKKLFKDIHRMLKPGGKFGCLDYVLLNAYDGHNPHHVDLMRRIKPLLGAIGSPSAETYTRLLEEAGFKILKSENASIDGLQAPLIENADKFFTRMNKLLNALVGCKLLPKHFKTLFDRLTQDGEAFVEADKLRLVTTSHYIVAQKV